MQISPLSASITGHIDKNISTDCFILVSSIKRCFQIYYPAVPDPPMELNENNPRHLTQMQIANSFGVCKATVSNIVKDYIEQGLDASITYKRNPNSNAKRMAETKPA